MGNLDAERDWGHARDYVDAMWRMLQTDEPDDYVIATGVTRSVRAFIEAGFGLVGLDWRKYVEVDQAFLRPADVNNLRGDASRAMRKLGWNPSTTFSDLVHEMVEHDLQLEGLDLSRYWHQPQTGVS